MPYGARNPSQLWDDYQECLGEARAIVGRSARTLPAYTPSAARAPRLLSHVTAMTLLLIRHGETQWSFERRFQGRLGSPLTERGIAQAAAIGRRLRALPETASAEIVASPLMQARRIAEIS